MRHRSCESILENKDKYRQKIDIISNRMIDLEKDIEEIKMKNSPLECLNNINNNEENNNKNDENISNNSNNINKNKNNYNLYFKYNNHKLFNYNNSNHTIHKNKSYSYISKEKLEYEYQLRILKRKLEALKSKNEELYNNVYNLKEKNNKIEYGLNSYNEINFDENKNNNNNNNNILEYENKNNKNILINKITELCQKSKYFYNSYENIENNDEYSILNILLNLMDIRFAYENSILYNSFLQGLEILFENKKEYGNLNFQNKIIEYITELINKEKKLKLTNIKYENLKKYYDLIKMFSSIKNLDNYLNIIIMKNIQVEQSINKIKNVLNDENSNYNGNNNHINKKKFIEQFIKRNNSNYNIDKFSFYTTNYYNNQINHSKYNNFNRNSNFLKKKYNERHNKSSCAINPINMSNTNYIKSKNKQYINKKQSSSKTIINNNNKPKNFNKIYSYSVSSNSKGNFNFNS